MKSLSKMSPKERGAVLMNWQKIRTGKTPAELLQEWKKLGRQ